VPDRLRLVFTTAPGSILSWAIEKIEGGDASHVGIQDGGIVYSAEQQGVVEQSLDKFLVGRRTVRIYEATEEGAKHLDLDRARAHLGDRYGFREIPGFLIVRLVELTTGKEISNPFGDRHAEVCSELALYLDDGTGYVTEFAGLDPDTTTPLKLHEALSRGGPTFTKIFG